MNSKTLFIRKLFLTLIFENLPILAQFSNVDAYQSIK